MKRTSNPIACRIVTLVLVAIGGESCSSDTSTPHPDAAADVASDTSKPDLATTDASTPDVPRADTAPDVPPADLGPADVVIAADVSDVSTVDQAPADVPSPDDGSTTDSVVADASDAGSSNPDGSPPDVPPATVPGLLNPRTVPVTASTPLAVAAGAMLPANNAAGVPVDTLLRIGFDTPPTLGTTGSIVIHLASDGSIVDTINIADPYAIYTGGTNMLTTNQTSSKVNLVGNLKGTGVSQVRVVNYVPVFISENTVTIVPHNNRLAYNTAYYVTMDNGLFAGTISSATFTGISDPTGWTFTTKAAAPTTLNVAADNSADFATVQGAVDSFAPGSTARTINIAPGVYQELLFLRSKNNVTFKGSNNGLDTVIQYDNSDLFNPGVGQGQTVSGGTIPGYGAVNPPSLNLAGGGRPVLLISSASGVVLDSITIKNLHAQFGRILPTLPVATTVDATATSGPTFMTLTPGTQAETIYFNTTFTTVAPTAPAVTSGTYAGTGPGTLVAKHSNFVSYQDTVQLKGISWFYDSFITGDTDFIWGNVNAALFEQCEIKSRFNANGASVVQSRAYVTAGTANPLADFSASYPGFVFLNSALTKEDGTFTAYLARSPGAIATLTGAGPFQYTGYDIVSYINCSMDAHIAPVGWRIVTAIPGANVRPNPIVGWREYHSLTPGGLPLDVTQRLADPSPTGTATLPGGSIQLSDANVAAFFPDRATILHGATDGTNSTTGLATFSPVP